MKNVEIVSPGAVGNALVKGVSAEQYRHITATVLLVALFIVPCQFDQ